MGSRAKAWGMHRKRIGQARGSIAKAWERDKEGIVKALEMHRRGIAKA